MSGTGYPNFESAFRGAANDVAKQQAVGDVGNTIKAGVGAGLLTGGGYALYRMLKKQDPRVTKRTSPEEAILPVKTADDNIIRDALHANNALDSDHVWWKSPAALAGGLIAGVGTAGLIRSTAGRMAASNRKAKEENARAQFDAALTKTLAPVSKLASDCDLGDCLVILFDTVKKNAGLQDIVDGALKGYGLYAVGTGLGAGALAYSASKDKNRKALQKALSMRQANRARSAPTEIILPGSLSQPPVLAGASAE